MRRVSIVYLSKSCEWHLFGDQRMYFWFLWLLDSDFVAIRKMFNMHTIFVSFRTDNEGIKKTPSTFSSKWWLTNTSLYTYCHSFWAKCSSSRPGWDKQFTSNRDKSPSSWVINSCSSAYIFGCQRMCLSYLQSGKRHHERAKIVPDLCWLFLSWCSWLKLHSRHLHNPHLDSFNLR